MERVKARHALAILLIWGLFYRPLLVLAALVAVVAVIEAVAFTKVTQINLPHAKNLKIHHDLPQSFESSLVKPHVELVFPSYPLLSQEIDEFINYVFKEFVSGWYSIISTDDTFERCVTSELHTILRNLHSSLSTTQYSDLIITKIVPAITTHFKRVVEAERVSQMLNTNITQAFGEIHPGVSTDSVDGENHNEKSYLRGRVQQLLPKLLSEQESNPLVRTFVTELLACTILTPVVNAMSDSDFYNMTMVNIIGNNLKHQERVNQLRAALEHHTLHHGNVPGDLHKGSMFAISERTDANSFQHILDTISNISSIEELDLILQLTEAQLKLARTQSVVARLWQLQEAVKKRRKCISSPEFVDVMLNLAYLEAFRAYLVKINHDRYLQIWEFIKLQHENNDESSSEREDDSTSEIDVFYERFPELSTVNSTGSSLHIKRSEVEAILLEDFEQFRDTDGYRKMLLVNPEVVEAVENALTQIMNVDEINDSPVNYEKYEGDAGARLTGIFGAENSSAQEQVDGPLLAAPSNLKLAQEISNIGLQIGKLQDQISVLEPLLRKAQLTQHTSEIKVLQKSKASLEREINALKLQRHQYIVQENENLLHGKTNVCIPSYVIENDKGREYVMYIIEVQKLSGDQILAGWMVARRFSQFYKLHEYLKAHYPSVTSVKFPKRMVATLKQKQLVDQRRRQLESYLREVIEDTSVCADRVFRLFLSNETFEISKSEEFVSTCEVDMNSMTSSYVKPITNLLTTVFGLNDGWLRGKAVVIIVQQVFGTTVDKLVNQQIDSRLRHPQTSVDVVAALNRIVFPGGKFRSSPPIRLVYERAETRQESSAIFRAFIHQTCDSIFGSSKSAYAADKLFTMIQHPTLNRHLLFTLLDIVFGEVFGI